MITFHCTLCGSKMSAYKEYTPILDVKYCFVPTCKSNSRNSQKRHFAVPTSAKLDWCTKIGVTCPKRVLYICEDHLNLEEEVENYQYWMTMKGRPRLKKTLPQSLHNILPSLHAELHEINKLTACTSSMSCTQVDMETFYEKSITADSHKEIRRKKQLKKKTSDQKTLGTLYERKMLLKKDVKGAKNKSKDGTRLPTTLESTSSVDVSEILPKVYVKTVHHGRDFMLDIIKNKPQSYVGLPRKYYWIINYLVAKLNTKSFNIIITLYKIKNNIPFYQISDMFQISLTALWRIFLKTLSLLSNFFKQFIFAPKVLDVERNLPSSFKTNKQYSNVYCIIDCLEIQIEKPSDPITQTLTWSQHKRVNTLKFLLATTPDGCVIFISAGFGGCVSDANIVEISGLLDVLPPNCNVLAVRGFKHVDSLLSKKHIQLLRPPTVLNNIEMTAQDAIKSKVVASLRIDIKRILRRIRLFKFLKPHSIINNKLTQHADEVVIVVCGLITLHSSIIKKLLNNMVQ